MRQSIGKEFIEKTKYKYAKESDQQKEIKQPPIEMPYDDSKLISLPNAHSIDISNKPFLEIIDGRHSLRKYSEQELTLSELSYLLWCTQGVKKIVDKKGTTGRSQATYRTVPSAGARHPFETYLLINRVDGLKPGIYRYIATKHQLLEITINDAIVDKVLEACYNQIFVKTAAVTFIWVADVYRSKWRYEERSYRYVLLDAGHVCQNLYLSAETIESGVCAIAAYDDDRLNTLLKLDGENQFVVYLGTLGKKHKK